MPQVRACELNRRGFCNRRRGSNCCCLQYCFCSDDILLGSSPGLPQQALHLRRAPGLLIVIDDPHAHRCRHHLPPLGICMQVIA